MMLPFAGSLLPFVFALLPAQAAPKPPAPAMQTFKSDVLGLTYSYPADLKNDPSMVEQSLKAERDKAQGLQKDALECVSMPLMAMNTDASLRMVMMIRLDQTCLGSSAVADDLGHAAKNTLGESLKRFGDPVLAAPVDYTVGGHRASLVLGTVTSEKFGITVHAAAVCAVAAKDTACWEFLASECADLSTMAASPVSFDGKAAEPLIPAGSVPACPAAKP